MSTKKSGLLFSILYMFLNFSSKYVSRNIVGIHRYTLLSARFGIAFILLAPIFIFYGNKMNSSNIKLQFLRAILVCIIIFLTYFGYANLPLSICSAISISEPIFVAIWSCLFGFEDKKSLPLIISITGIAALGMLLMINPDFRIKITPLPVIALILSNIICSINHFLTIKLTKRDSTIGTLMYNILFVSAILLSTNIVIALFGQEFNCQPISANKFKLMSLGVFAAVNSWIGLSALNRVDANIHTNIQNLSLPLSVIIGHFEGDQISFKVIIGTAAILTTLFLLEYRKKPSKKYRIVSFISIIYLITLILWLTRYFYIEKMGP